MPSKMVLLALLAGACHRSDGAEDDNAHGPRVVTCARAVASQVSDTLDVRGTVAPLPDRDAQVSPQVAGRISRVLVREGDPVKAGQPLAQIDTSPLEDDVTEARANVARARAERDNAETTMRRVQRLFDRGIAARQEVDDAQARSASARAGEAQAAAAARRASSHIERATVRSPLDGVVLKVMRRSGELADGTPATPVVEVGDPSHVELVGDAPGADLARLARGAAAIVTIAGASHPGHVAAVSPAVDRLTGLGVVRVTLETPSPVGMFGLARIASGPARPAVMVPAVALRNAVGAAAEVVACGETARVVAVQTGVRVGELVEVKGALRAGDRVAVAPVLGLVEGDRLTAPADAGAHE
jgi:RND family efflux transporter MFP subunit